MPFYPTIHGIHIGQHIAQTLIVDIMGYQIARCPHELFAMGEKSFALRAQIEEIHLVSQPIKCIHVVSDALSLMGELTDKVIGKGLTPLWDTIGMPIGEIGDAVDALVIHIA